MLRVDKLTKAYRITRREKLTAVKEVSFEIKQGETLGLVGDSGSGKSTIGQMICGLLKPTSGEIRFKGQRLKYPMQKDIRRSIQILFQHPEISFNPKLKIYDSMKEPYILYKNSRSRQDIIDDIVGMGLKEEHLFRYPRELSGGELQRMALARVLAVQPELIVLDEPTSMLDVVSQAQIIGILKEYQKKHHTSYLFISHHLILAKQFCSRMLRIQDGAIENFDMDALI